MTRCIVQRFCCLSIKDGLEAIGYVKIMISYTTLLYVTGGFYAQFQNTGRIDVTLNQLLVLCCFTGDFVCTALHLFSLRRDILPLITLYFDYLVLTLVAMVVGLPFYFYYVLLSPEPALALRNVWPLVGVAVLAWFAIGLHLVLAIGVNSYGAELKKRREQARKEKTEVEMRRVSV